MIKLGDYSGSYCMADVFMKIADLDTKTDTYMEDTVKHHPQVKECLELQELGKKIGKSLPKS